ncbi:MAG: primosomal protein N' [Alphaproteobacteria bacterium]|nr:primosomal protein N' [Alphaproteobacteria bacterium]
MIDAVSYKARQIEVLLPKPFNHGFDYSVPADIPVQVGDYVRVPFGRQTMVGVVWGEGKQEVDDAKLKPITEHLQHLSPLSSAMRSTIDWVSRYTLAPKGMVLKMALPVAEALELPTTRQRKTVSSAPINSADEKPSAPCLSAEQAKAAAVLGDTLHNGFSVTVLDGVTGSGKTEVYFDAIAKILAVTSGQVLVLLPEIALSVQWVERCKTRFGTTPYMWHSGVTPAKRRDTWRAITNGSARLIVGARSALFLPYKDLQLLVVDEEHEQSYKQEDGVLYQARDMAVARAFQEKIPAILVSATPALETVFNIQQGRYAVVQLPQRHGGVQLPDVNMIDMRQQQLESGTWISAELRTAIAETLAAKRQTMLFLNRRGYAPLLLCRTCGHRFACDECSSWMVLHGKNPNKNGKLQCHHCGHTEPVPESCPQCGEEETLVACGPGVERVAEEVQAAFPQARVRMMTSDTIGGLTTAEDTVQAMTRGEIDIMVGTQMMAKGYHFPHLHLIGVVDADLGLQGGDMRAAERTYQLLHQVAGRAGREQEQGRVILQTYLPEHPVMLALAAHDRKALEDMELDARKETQLPPFGRLAALIIEAQKETDVMQACRALAARIPANEEIRVLGPAPAPLTRLRGRYRYRFLIRSGRDIQLQPYVNHWLSQFDFPARIRIRVDIDPYSFT